VEWLVGDQLGTPRMIFDKTSSLANTKRHDYLPFGEELFATVNGRTTAQGYTGDNIRQKFTQKERDNETGLDYFGARYYSSTQGRFTSVDPENAGANPSDPQSWNGYAYARNNPLLYVDPDGLDVEVFWNGSDRGKWYGDAEFERFKKDLQRQGFIVKNGNIYAPVMDDDGNVVGQRRIGTYVSDMNPLGEGVGAELSRRNPAFQRFGQVGLLYMSFFTLPASEATLMTGWLTRGLETSATEAATATTTAITAAPQAASAVKNAISGFTKHGIDSAISHDGVGVSTRAILNTLKNPLKVVPQSGGRVKVVGKEAIVILNRAGKVITTWARSTAGTRIQP
jgi:RHS repeat-associated protein